MMQINIVNYALGFIEGFALILSPCILPILPIILSSAMTGGKRRPLGIIIGFTLFFALFSLLSGLLLRHTGINLDLIRKISYLLIIGFGIILISDTLSSWFSKLTQGFANKASNLHATSNNQGLMSGIYFGALISLVWVPCGGPILAAAIVHMAVQKTFLSSFITFLFFALGSVLPMIFIAIAGKKIIAKISWLKNNTQLLRKIFGCIIIIAAILTGFIGSSTAWNDSKKTMPQEILATLGNTLIDPLPHPYPAPAFNTKTTWLNSPPLTLPQLKGKVVLIDFWTYSCINCIRTFPYLQDWYHKYHDKGLEIIGIHAPEFEFEKKLLNVKQAIQQYHIPYPVILDNDYIMWQRYNNQYWPALYLIDKNGDVVYQHFGEGNDAETEYNIRVLLGLTGKTSLQPSPNLRIYPLTPETYLGYSRASNYGGTPSLSQNTMNYNFPATLPLNTWALKGKWLIQAEKIQALDQNTAIKLHFSARYIYMVMGSKTHQPITVHILYNNKPLVNKDNSAVYTVNGEKLYTILSLPSPQTGEIEVQFTEPGVEVYTFTFG